MQVAASISINAAVADPAPSVGERRRERFVRILGKGTLSPNGLMGVALPSGAVGFQIFGCNVDETAQLPEDLDTIEIFPLDPSTQSGSLDDGAANTVMHFYSPGWYYIQVTAVTSATKRVDLMPVTIPFGP